ncbi:hypothetical protein QTP88_010377 [Uroleucon formosanum]
MDQNQCIQFIELYRNYPVLWNPKLKDYHNRNKKEDVWKDISAEMDIPVHILKPKMKSLMGTYRSERSRENKKTTGSADRFVATHLNALDSSSKLFRSKQLRYNGNSVSVSLDSNETTTNIVEKVNLNNYYRENESSPASSHGTEQNSLELNISESSDGSKNLSNKLEHDINNDIQSTSLSVASLDAFENWKGQGKSDVPKLVIKNKDVPKKRLTTYMDPTPEIDRLIEKNIQDQN